MAWTATLVGVFNGGSTVNIALSDGQGNTYNIQTDIPLGASSTFLSDFVATEIASMTARAGVVASVPNVGSSITPTIAVPDPNASIKAQFTADYLQLRQYKAAIANGIITATDAGYVALLTKITTEFQANEAILLPLIPVGP